MRNGAVEKV